MRLILSLLALAFLVQPSNAQEIRLPAEVRGAPGSWLIVAPEKIDGGAIKWRIDPALQEVRLDLLLPPEMLAKLKGKVLTGQTGRYKVEAWTAKGDVPSDISTCWIIIGDAPPTPVPPGPTPDPTPKPDPKPDPKPSPIAKGKLLLVIIEETADARKDRGAWFTYLPLFERMKERQHRFILADKDVVDSKGKTPPALKPYIDRAKGKLPWFCLVGEDGDELGRVFVEGALPPSAADLLAILRKVGG